MKYTEFRIKNFKGIRDETLQLNVRPEIKIFTLVGLNESGKTSVLEAINSFQNGLENKDSVIPKDKKMNFNSEVSVAAKIALDDDDEKEIKDFLGSRGFILKEEVGEIEVTKTQKYKNSNPTGKMGSNWSINIKGNRAQSKKKSLVSLGADDALWQETVKHIKDEMFPKIIMYQNFLFEVPSKLYIAKSPKPTSGVVAPELNSEDPYFLLIQDVLDSLESALNIKEHLLDRVVSGKSEELDHVAQVLNAMSAKVSEEVFQTWGKVSKVNIRGKEITFGDSVKHDAEGYFLELKVKEGAKTYSVQERSLGFRWYFAFLLFTQFRKFRNGDPKNTLFLLDEPASNLHQTGQQELLTLLESLTDKSNVIYSTHSHHLISPKWLAGAYIVKNEAIDPDAKTLSDVLAVRATDIKVDKYFNFAAQNPGQSTHFQPVLDILEYRPSALEQIDSIVITEGKFDYYNLMYLSRVKKEPINYYPGIGAGSLASIISLYLAWGRSFIVLLDADKGGKKEKGRYLEDFGDILQDKVFCLDDIDPAFNGFSTEKLTTNSDSLAIMQEVFPNRKKYDKKLYNTAIQKLYIDGKIFEYSKDSLDNFEKVIKFIKNTLV